jgi:biopolymer transport protein TolQ
MEVYLVAVQATDDTGIDVIDVVVWLVLALLLLMSVISWGIMLFKWVRLLIASRQSNKFLDVFWNSKRLDSVYEQVGKYRRSPVAEVFKAGYQELAKVQQQGGKSDDAADNLARSLRRARMVEQTNLERFIPFLATTGSTAPFIGLFGTVVGIQGAFSKLAGAQQATIQVVGPDISHALVATAAGLLAAIPAVMAYNYFNARLRVLTIEMENFSGDFLNIVKRHLN